MAGAGERPGNPTDQTMQIQTVHTRIIAQTATAIAVPIVALTARWALGEGMGKYSSLWIVVVGSVLVAGLGWLTRGALIEYDATPTEDLSESYLVALDKATKSLATAEAKSKELETQNQRLQDRSLSLELRVRELETPAVPAEPPKPAGIVDGLRTVIDVAGERATTTLTGGSQLEVGLALSKEEVEGVQTMLDSLGRKLARLQVEELIEATSGDALPRILLVEDDLTSRRLVKALLPKDLKAVILEVEDGLSALQSMEKPPYPDIIICDVLMPNMDGLEFLTRLRDLPRFSNTPVVMISANAFKENVAKAATLKVHRFLRKPLDRKDLSDAVEAAMKEISGKDSSLFKAQQRLCLDDKAYFELSAGFSRAIAESVTFVRSSISRDRWQAATIRVNALSGSIQMVGDERLSVAIGRVEKQLRNSDINGVTIELEVLEQENERFMRTLVHSFNAMEAQETDGKTEAG